MSLFSSIALSLSTMASAPPMTYDSVLNGQLSTITVPANIALPSLGTVYSIVRSQPISTFRFFQTPYVTIDQPNPAFKLFIGATVNESKSSRQNSFDSELKASWAWGRVRAGYSARQETSGANNEAHLIVKFNRQTKLVAINEFGVSFWSQEARNALLNDPTNINSGVSQFKLNQFKQNVGEYVVLGEIYGYTVGADFNVTSAMNAYRSSRGFSFNGSYGSASGSAAINSILEGSSQNATTNLNIEALGLWALPGMPLIPNPPTVSSVQTWVTNTYDYFNNVGNFTGDGTTVMWVCVPVDDLALLAATPDITPVGQRLYPIFQEAEYNYYMLDRMIRKFNLEYVSVRRNLYLGLVVARENLRQYFEMVEALFHSEATNPGSVTNAQVDALTLPKVPWPVVNITFTNVSGDFQNAHNWNPITGGSAIFTIKGGNFAGISFSCEPVFDPAFTGVLSYPISPNPIITNYYSHDPYYNPISLDNSKGEVVISARFFAGYIPWASQYENIVVRLTDINGNVVFKGKMSATGTVRELPID